MSNSEAERLEQWMICHADRVKENGLTALALLAPS